MKDALSRYEQQLRRAVRRQARGRRATGLKTPRGLALVGAVLVLAAAPAFAAVTGVWGGNDEPLRPDLGPPPPERMVVDEGVSCTFDTPPEELTTTAEPPSDALLQTLGVLRRPASELDRFELSELGPAQIGGVHTNFIRRVGTTPSGKAYWVVPAENVRKRRPMPQECLDQLPAGQRRRAEEQNERIRQQEPTPGLCLMSRSGGGCGTTIPDLRAGHVIGTAGNSETLSEVHGLVPDGVASVTVRYRDGTARTVAVQGNFFSYEVALSAERAFPEEIVWRDEDNASLRTVRLP